MKKKSYPIPLLEQGIDEGSESRSLGQNHKPGDEAEHENYGSDPPFLPGPKKRPDLHQYGTLAHFLS